MGTYDSFSAKVKCTKCKKEFKDDNIQSKDLDCSLNHLKQGEDTRWITNRKGTSHNMSIGSNCRCWMCQAVTKFIDRHHFTHGKARLIAQDKLIDYLAYRMGYTGTKITRLKDTFPEDNKD